MSTANPYETSNVSMSSISSRRTVTLKSVDVLSSGIFVGAFHALLGLLAGAIFSLFAVVGAAAQQGGAVAGIAFGVGAVILMPLMYGIMGFIVGIIAAVFYNSVASLTGGLKMDLE